jgi:hypothetical protein
MKTTKSYNIGSYETTIMAKSYSIGLMRGASDVSLDGDVRVLGRGRRLAPHPSN